MAGNDTKSIIVTFKRKDKRADKKKDKVEIVRAVIDRSVAFFDASAVTPTALRGLDPVEIGYDVADGIETVRDVEPASLEPALVDGAAEGHDDGNGTVSARFEAGPQCVVDLTHDVTSWRGAGADARRQ